MPQLKITFASPTPPVCRRLAGSPHVPAPAGGLGKARAKPGNIW